MMTIQVVGIGLDGKESLSDTVKKIVDEAQILIGSERHLSYFPNHPAKQVKLTNFSQIIEEIKILLETDQSLVILATGDPLFFGIGRLLLENFRPEQLQFYPNLNCVQLAFNHLKIPYQDAEIISVHGRDLEILTPYLQKGVEKLAILTDNINHPLAIAQFYLSLEIPCQYQLIVCENLGDITEKITSFSFEELHQLTFNTEQNFSSLNVVIFLRQALSSSVNLPELPLLGVKDHIFASFSDRPSLMTKKEIRTLILGELELQSNQIIWDIGAGTGSVSIEIARLCPTSQIYAIEKTAMGIHLIEKNSQKFQVLNIIPILANAPDGLFSLPSPHRIFIGGSGNNIIKILNTCQEKLQENGIVVITLATLENFYQALTWFQEKSWIYDLLQIQISRSVPIGNLTRFSPLNPVTIITARKP